MLNAHQARDFVERMARVRIYSGAVAMEDVVLAEGNVMSYIDAPSIELLHDDGKLKSWSTRLRIEEVAAPDPVRPRVAITHEVIMAFLDAPGEDADDITGPLRAAFEAAGIAVVADD